MIATLLRKPIKKTVSQNALENGCGGLNIDATRVGYSDSESIDFNAKQRQQADPKEKGWSGHVAKVGTEIQMHKEKGRWPANFILTHLESCISQGKDWACVEGCPVKELDRQSGRVKGWSSQNHNTFNPYQGNSFHNSSTQRQGYKEGYNDNGGASRFFKQVTSFKDLLEYLALLITPPKEIKSNIFVGDSDEFLGSIHESLHGAIIVGEFSKEESENLFSCFLPGSHLVLIPYESYNAQAVIHLEDSGFEVRDSIFIPEKEEFMYAKKASKKEREKGLEPLNNKKRKNIHPTVKPISIMEWCLRDIPKDTIVLDPFMGSGTTGIAAVKKGHLFVGMEINQEYLEIASARIKGVKNES